MLLLNVTQRPFWGAILPGLVAGLLLLLAFPPFDAWGWWLVFPALVPLVVVAARTSSPLRSGLGSCAGGLVFWGWQQSWVIDVSAIGVFPLVLYLALWPGLFVWLLGRIAGRLTWMPLWIAGPVVWGGMEVLRGEVVWNGYPWFLAGHPTIHWPGLASLASVGGVYLVSACVALPACALGEAVAGRARGRGGEWAWAGALVAVALLGWCASPWSWDRIGAPDGEAPVAEGRAPVRFGVVQTSVAQDNKLAWSPERRIEDFRRFAGMTRMLAEVEPPPDVIVWPETMFPGYSLSPEAVDEERRAGLAFTGLDVPVTVFHDALLALQGELGIPMIVGAAGVEGLSIAFDEDGRVRAFEADAEHNSAFVLSDGRVTPQRYDKMHLTPFGEVMPYISAWPALERALLDIGARGMAFNLSAGDAPVALDVPVDGRAIAVATPICFEISSAGVVRRLVFDGVRRRAGVIVQLTNDGWFGEHPGGRSAHLMIARWRAIELATPVVRAANTGISAAIDGAGRIVRRWAIPIEPGAEVGHGPNPAGVLTAALVPASDRAVTPFVRWGRWTPWAALGATALLLLGSLRPGPRAARGASGEEPENRAGGGARTQGGPAGVPDAAAEQVRARRAPARDVP